MPVAPVKTVGPATPRRARVPASRELPAGAGSWWVGCLWGPAPKLRCPPPPDGVASIPRPQGPVLWEEIEGGLRGSKRSLGTSLLPPGRPLPRDRDNMEMRVTAGRWGWALGTELPARPLLQLQASLGSCQVPEWSFDGTENPWPRAYAVAVPRGSLGHFKPL